MFVDFDPIGVGRDVSVLAKRLLAAAGSHFKLDMISNRGVVVWPNGHPDTFKVFSFILKEKIRAETFLFLGRSLAL